jgi:hypothetical protein
LLPAALALAALSAGLSADATDGLAELGRVIAAERGVDGRLQSLNLDAPARERLEALTTYLSEVRGE